MVSHVATRQTSQPQRAEPQRASSKRAPKGPVPLHSNISQLQRAVGNQGLHRLVQRYCQACAQEKEKEMAGGHRDALPPKAAAHRVFGRPIQPKLQIGKAGDIYEQEADRVADAIMGMSDRDQSAVSATSPAAVGAQRKCAACEGEEKVVRPFAPGSRDGLSLPQATESQIESGLIGTGQPLAESARRFFEPRFGHDFRHVRVHADGRSAESARAIDALAFTVGRDIVFGAGQYAPESAPGRHLLAHELTHVVQQTAGTGGGKAAQRKLVEQRVAAPSLQARWRLDRVTPLHGVDANRRDENGSTTALHSGGMVFGEANTWQTTGIVHQHVGGQAQLAHWVTSHYVFRNDGTSNDTLELTAIGQLSGSAKAEDNHYARSAAVVWGQITERTPENPTPPGRQLFEIHDGGISAGIVRDLGQIDVDLPLGEKGNVHITIPLRYVSEGALAPFSKPALVMPAVAGSVSEVDVLLGAQMKADADIETEFFGVAPWLSRNYNISRAFGSFQLLWQNRPAPAPVTAPLGAAGSDPAPSAAYRCNARCQENCNGEATRYLEGTSTQNCGEATRDAKSKAARGCYPRHCSCRDTEGFRGTGTQCENHKR